MALPTAPCPACKTTIVFGQRRCRACGQAFEYGAHAPPEPTAEQVFDALMQGTTRGGGTGAIPGRGPTLPPSDPSLPGLETGRYARPNVAVVPSALIDSTRRAPTGRAFSSVAPLPRLEPTQLPRGDVNVANGRMPGLTGSDVFRVDVDVRAGASLNGGLLEVTAHAGRHRRADDDDDEPGWIVCPACSTHHTAARCPGCGQRAVAHDDDETARR
jgi:hypothetical protein